ncbi:MAG: transglutaminase domain-containing protein [bacterium]
MNCFKNFMYILSIWFTLFFACEEKNVRDSAVFAQEQEDQDIPDTDTLDLFHEKDAAKEKDSTYGFSRLDLPENVKPSGIAVIKDEIFIADINYPSILRTNIHDGKVLRRVPVKGSFPAGLDFDGETLLSTDLFEEHIERYRAFPGDKRSPLPFYGSQAWGISSDGNSLYVVDRAKREILKIDREDGSVISTFPAPGKKPSAITSDGNRIWVADADSRRIYMMDPEKHWIVHQMDSQVSYPSGLAIYGKELLVSDLSGHSIVKTPFFPDKPYSTENWERYEVDFRIIHKVEGDGAVKNLNSFIAVPQSRPGQKILGDVAFSPEPDEIVTDEWGQKYASFHHERLETGSELRINMTVEFETADLRYAINPEKIPSVFTKGLKNPQKYLRDEKKYDISSETIAKILKNMKIEEEKGLYAKARKIYEKLAASITYDLNGGWGRASTVLKRKTGSCSEYTFSLISLLRASGIPARYVGAYVNRAEKGGIDYVFHRWAEIWMGPYYGWVPVDANAGHEDDILTRAGAFAALPGRYLITTVSGGESEYMDWSYNYNTDYSVEGNAVLSTHPLAHWKNISQ